MKKERTYFGISEIIQQTSISPNEREEITEFLMSTEYFGF